MADTHTKEQRSQNMSAIRSRGNKSTEMAFLNILKSHKITGWRRHLKKLPGKPDFAFPKHKIAIFIDGCFWHKCPKCYKEPKSNKEYWLPKIERNVKRDRLNKKALSEKDWHIVRIWEHQIKKNPSYVNSKIRKLLREF